MARKDVHKLFRSDAYYHIYNRGTNRQIIFFENKDYWVFRRFAKQVLQAFKGEVRIECFALLENHFHLLFWQGQERNISKFMRSLMGKYSYFIRKKYQIIGQKYESPYKAVILESEQDIERIRNYILSNPLKAGLLSWKHVGIQL